MEINALEFNSNMQDNPVKQTLKNTLIVEYGRIVKVLDISHVVVKQAVQVGIQEYFYTVTLLSMGGAYGATVIEPCVGDSVAMLFVRTYNGLMFNRDIVDSSASGYNYFSGIGFLAQPNGNIGNVTLCVGTDNANFTSTVDTVAEFENNITVALQGGASIVSQEGSVIDNMFLDKVNESYGVDFDGKITSDKETEATKKVLFGKKSNLESEYRGKVETVHKGNVKTDYQENVESSFAKKSTVDNNGSMLVKSSNGTGSLEVKGTGIPDGKGVMCAIPYCPFSGAPQCAGKAVLSGA